MEAMFLWLKALPSWLADWANVIVIALVFATAFTLVCGVWVGYYIARKRMNAIVELEFFPPRIRFKDANKKITIDIDKD